MMTVITRVELRDGAQAEWDAAMHERLAAAQDQPGWIGGQLLRPLDQHSARVIVGTWASREDWVSWHDAEAFRETRQRLEGLQAGAGEMVWHEAIEDRRVD